jgi:N-acetylmuramoyl-L-alanine amidase
MNKEDVKFLVVHCSYTPPAMDIGASDIDRWHREKGWLGIGYHFVIKRDGTIENGRPITKQGAHVKGLNNRSIGVCMIGGMLPSKSGPDINYTDAQWKTLREKLDELRKDHFPHATVKGHTDFDKGKTCPNFDAGKWYETEEIVPTI